MRTERRLRGDDRLLGEIDRAHRPPACASQPAPCAARSLESAPHGARRCANARNPSGTPPNSHGVTPRAQRSSQNEALAGSRVAKSAALGGGGWVGLDIARLLSVMRRT
jgi:hypothetical protein